MEYACGGDLFEQYNGTELPDSTIRFYIANLVLSGRAAGVPGAIVECGTWKGGMIAGIASLLGASREYYLYDSFEGLPPAEHEVRIGRE